MPRMIIEWVSAGSREADEALFDRIAEVAMPLLADLDGDCSGYLAFDRDDLERRLAVLEAESAASHEAIGKRIAAALDRDRKDMIKTLSRF
jgi:hypothetical protein